MGLDIGDDLCHRIGDRLAIGFHHQFRRRGRFIGGAHPGEFGDFTLARLHIEALWVATLTRLYIGLDEYLMEAAQGLAGGQGLARAFAIGAVGRDEGGDDDLA